MLAISFWNAVWLVFISFMFIAYLMVLFSILVDLFSDHEVGGFAKAIWVVALLLVPLLTALVYLIVRGGGMAKRTAARQATAQAEVNSYIRDVAGAGAASELARAAELHENGKISDEEFAALKTKIMA
jgi:uncharacterized membrane protein